MLSKNHQSPLAMTIFFHQDFTHIGPSKAIRQSPLTFGGRNSVRTQKWLDNQQNVIKNQQLPIAMTIFFRKDITVQRIVSGNLASGLSRDYRTTIAELLELCWSHFEAVFGGVWEWQLSFTKISNTQWTIKGDSAIASYLRGAQLSQDQKMIRQSTKCYQKITSSQ